VCNKNNISLVAKGRTLRKDQELSETSARHRQGILITLEGIDGTGKTTISQGLADCMNKMGLEVCTYAAPSRVTKAAKELRKSFHNGGEMPIEDLLTQMSQRGYLKEPLRRSLRLLNVEVIDGKARIIG